MAYGKRPTKTVFRKASNVMTDAEIRMKQEAVDPAISKTKIIQAKLAQHEIDKYNKVDIYKIDPHFKNLMLTGHWMIVRLKMEDLIKYIDESNPDNVVIDAWIRQVDARERTTDKPHWVPTPFPFVEEGIIVAISPLLQKEFYNLKEELAKYNSEQADNIIIPEIGMTVHVRANTSQWFKDHRYYIDKQKQCMDFVRNQTELRLNNFEYYFRLEDFELENIYRNEDTFGKWFWGDQEEPEWFTEETGKYDKLTQEAETNIKTLLENSKKVIESVVDDTLNSLTEKN